MSADADRKTATLMANLSLELLACAVAGVMMYLFWQRAGLPAAPPVESFLGAASLPARLKLFACFLVPAAFALPSVALCLMIVLLPRGDDPGGGLSARVLRWDAAGYLFLPLAPAVLFVGSQLGDWILALALIFMGTLALKGAMLLYLLWRGFLSLDKDFAHGLAARTKTAAVVALAAPLILAAAWTSQAQRALPGELSYLGAASSLLSPIYRLRPEAKPKAVPDKFEAPPSALYSFVISPAAALLGRPGVLAGQGLLAALAALQIYLWLGAAGVRAGPSAMATGLWLASAPVLMPILTVGPTALAILLLAVGLRLLMHLESAPHWSLGGLTVVVMLLMQLEPRLVSLGLGLLAAYAVDLVRIRFGRDRALYLGVLLVLALGVALRLWSPGELLFGSQVVTPQDPEMFQPAWQGVWAPYLALLLDQSAGILVSGPVMVLALAGLPLALKHRPRAAAHALTPLALFVVALCASDGCLVSPENPVVGRLAAAGLVGLSLFMALAISALSRPGWRLLVLAPAALGLVITWLMELAPPLRMVSLGQGNPLARGLGDFLGLRLDHMLPDMMTPWPPAWAWVLAALAVLGVYALAAWRRYADDAAALAAPAAPAPPPGAASFQGLALILVLAATGWVAASGLLPPPHQEAERMLQSPAPAPGGPAHGAVLKSGGALTGRIHLPGGPVRLAVTASCQRPGILDVELDSRPVGSLAFDCLNRRRSLSLGRQAKGRRMLRLSWRSNPGGWLMVDRVSAQPAPRPIAGPQDFSKQ